MPTPKKEVSLADDEIDLFSELEKQKKSSYKTIDPSALITTEQNTFYSLGEKIRIDLYQSVLNKIVIPSFFMDEFSVQVRGGGKSREQSDAKLG